MNNLKKISPNQSEIKTGTPGLYFTKDNKFIVGGIGGNYIPGYYNIGIYFNGSRKTATKVTIPQPDITSGDTNFQYFFYDCEQVETIDNFNASNGTSFNAAFMMCYYLKSIPNINTPNNTSFSWAFYSDLRLSSIPLLNCTKVEHMDSTFYNCVALTNLGGFSGLKVSIDLHWSESLTHDSLINVINNLATVSTTQTLILGETNLAKLTEEEKAIATNKGWTLA